MIIKSVEIVDPQKTIKHKIYDLAKALSSHSAGLRINLIVLLVIQMFLTFVFSSIMFKSEDHFPSIFSSVFRIFLLGHFAEQLGVNIQIITAILILVTSIIFIFTILHFVLQNIPPIITNALTIMIILAQSFIVILTDFAVDRFLEGLNSETSLGWKIICFTTIILIFFTIVILSLKIFLDLRVLRKRTTFWNLSNVYQLKFTCFFILKTIYINLYGTSLLLYLMSIGFYGLLMQQKSGIIPQPENSIMICLIKFLALTEISILLSLVTGLPDFAVRIWIFGFLLLILGYAIMIVRSKERKLFLPICESPPEMFYDFYYNCREQLKGEDVSDKHLTPNNAEIFHLHRFNCPQQNCKLSEWLYTSQNTLESICTTIIKEKSKQTLQNRIIYILWEIELGHSCNLSSLESKPLTMTQQYLIYYLKTITRDNDVILQNKANESKEIANTFYDLIYEIGGYYASFYQILGEVQPSVDDIQHYGMLIFQKMEVLKNVYNQLIKKRLINFKMIEIYIQFMTRFVSEDTFTKEDIARLSKIQAPPFDDISENYKPTLALYPETGKIENVNSEAQKFLKMTRFQLKSKSIEDLTSPKLTVDILSDSILGDQKEDEEPLYIFFKISQERFLLGNIKAVSRLMKGKKLLIVEITQNIFSSQKNAFLIDDDFKMVLSQSDRIKIRKGPYRQNPLQMRWSSLFQEYLVLHQQKIMKNKMIKISISSTSCTAVIKRFKCAVPHFHILEVQVYLNDESVRTHKKSTRVFSLKQKIPNKKNFQFHYIETDNEERSLLRGRRNIELEMKIRDSFNLTNFLRQSLNGLNEEKAINLFPQYGQGIKTYRLYKGDLYNIDYQDKEAYLLEFQGKEPQRQKRQIQKNTSFECYSLVGAILFVIALLGVSVFFILVCEDSTSAVALRISAEANIQCLFIDFNRIQGLLRDISTGFSSKFPHISFKAEIDDSYSRIQALRKKPLFDSKGYTMNFTGLQINGTMPQLLDVLFAHTNELLHTGNFTIIPEILTAGVRLIYLMEDILHQSPIETILQHFEFSELLCLYLSIAILALLIVLVVYFIYRSHRKIVSYLTSLLLMSDSDCNVLQENALKIKYAVEMIRKQYDGDMKDLIFMTADHKKRKHPKKVAFCSQIIVTVMVLIAIAVGVHIGCMVYFHASLKGAIQKYKVMKASFDIVTEVYFESAQIVNLMYVEGKVNQHNLEELDLLAKEIMYSIGSYPFSPQLNQFIETLFYSNSCPLLTSLNLISAQNCHLTAPEFTQKNPFEVGLAYYLIRQQYYFLNNITQIYAHTSVYSKTFVEIITNLTLNMTKQSSMVIMSAHKIVHVVSYIIIAIDIGYVLAFLMIHSFFKRQMNNIRIIVDLFRKRTVRKQEKEEEKQDIDDNQVEEQKEEEPQSDEELCQEEKKGSSPPRDRRRKRTTIQSNLPLLDLHLE